MGNHTPGPWEWFDRPNGIYLATPHSGHLLVLDTVRSGMNGATLRFATWKGEERGRMGGLMRKAADIDMPNHPDARLISAAPDLLTACEAAEFIIARERKVLIDSHCIRGDKSTIDDDVKPDLCQIDSALQSLRAAIAKAKGPTQ